jgi:PPK2 family polyphosphate:nucleotide phosphotransferase
MIRSFKIDPGTTINLNSIDPSLHGDEKKNDQIQLELEHNLNLITNLQRKLYAEKKHSLLIILQGFDASGKDGTCWHVINAMDPLGVQVNHFKTPTEEERDHDFLWRIHARAPALGNITIFNRSQYEDVLAARVDKLVPEIIWRKRYNFINEWEKLLTTENNTKILKFFLHISKEEQLRRFKERLNDPKNQWKISLRDYSEREKWDEYVSAYEDLLSLCSTKYAPWFIIPANHKWYRNLIVSKIIANTLEDMNLQMPRPQVNIDEIRNLYHKASEIKS